LALAYASVQAPMLAAMARANASLRRLLVSPLIAAPATLLAGAATALVSPLLRGVGIAPTSLLQLTVGAGISLGTGYVAGHLIARTNAAPETRERGTVLARAQERKQPKAAIGPDELTLAGVRVALTDETKHFKLVGTTGTGKSTAIAQMLERALGRGDRAVIADPDGGYLSRFYDGKRGDVVLNPFDQRSMKWDLFREIRREYDIDQLARSLIPDHGGEDRSWRGYARTFFSAVTRQAQASGVRNMQELYRLLTIADTDELQTLTRGTPAQPFLEPNNAKMFHSLRSVTSSAVASLEYVANQQSPSLSIRDWIDRDQEKGGVLFIPYRAGQIAALRSTISAWMRIAIFAAMDQEEGDQRLWFVIDELDALGPIDGLKDALARVRKFGGRCVLGFQSIAQVASTYGEGEAHTIVENCGNSLILRCSASDGGGTSRFASTLIGQRQVRRTTISRSTHDASLFGSSTTSDHFSIEPAVMDSEIEQIPDLCGYLKLASRAEWLRVRLASASRRRTAGDATPAFVPVVPTATESPPASAPSAAAAAAATPHPIAKPKRRPRTRAPSADADSGRATAPSPTVRARRTKGAAAKDVTPRSNDARGCEP
jgi:hypothetical protein